MISHTYKWLISRVYNIYNNTVHLLHIFIIAVSFLGANISISFALADDTKTKTTQIDQSALLDFYKELADVNKTTLVKTSDTLDLIMKLAVFVTTLLAGSGILSYYKAHAANRMAAGVEKELKKLTANIKTLEVRISSDAKILDRLHAIDDIDKYTVKYCSDKPIASVAGKKGLLNILTKGDAIIRLACIHALARVIKYESKEIDDEMRQKLEEIMESDDENAVRSEARIAVESMTIFTGKRK